MIFYGKISLEIICPYCLHTSSIISTSDYADDIFFQWSQEFSNVQDNDVFKTFTTTNINHSDGTKFSVVVVNKKDLTF